MPEPQPFLDIALAVARLLEQVAATLVATATPIEAAERLPPIANAIVKLARCSRQEQAFARKCAEQDATPAREAAQAAATRATARRRIIRIVEDAIAEAPLNQVENLLSDFHERLDDPALEEDLLTREVGVIIHELLADHGIPHAEGKPPRRDAIDIAILAARARAPLSRPPLSRPVPANTS